MILSKNRNCSFIFNQIKYKTKKYHKYNLYIFIILIYGGRLDHEGKIIKYISLFAK